MKKTVGSNSRQLAVKFFTAACFCLLTLFLSSCAELEKPKTEPFYAKTAPTGKKEFRWSNGKMPKSFDPALAAASPETDIVRAVFEGLTDTNPQTLEAIPAIATKWEASEDFKTWTFYLRKDAKWSNGERVTAKDFERSWKRLAELGEKVSHRKLLQNIVGMKPAPKEILPVIEQKPAEIFTNSANQNVQPVTNQTNANTLAANPTNTEKKTSEKAEDETKFGVEAADNFTLKISLVNADKNFPALVAHPLFRPIYGDGKDFETGKLNAAIVTNGAFRISSIGQDGVTLDRAENFWNRDKIELERVRFVPTENAETALEFYRNGEVDAVTNVDFAPLALKILEPYDDFHRTTHSALNFYEFNLEKPPFNDRRVREALAIAIERERLTEGTTEGATKPAFGFFPFSADKNKLTQDVRRAKILLEEAGFPDGKNFPKIKLVVNRNDIQQRIARSVKQMWAQNLNLETEVVVIEAGEMEAVVKAGDYDVLRRGEVLPTVSETANLMAVFPPKPVAPEEKPTPTQTVATGEVSENADPTKENSEDGNAPGENAQIIEIKPVLTEEEAINELPAIPLYFPTTYSLVKPYVQGFEMNALDAPSLKNVRIDNDWKP